MITHHWRILTGALLILGLSGCGTLKGDFTTKKEPDYQDQIRIALVVSYIDDSTSKLGRDFSKRLLDRLTALLTQKSVLWEIVQTSPKNLDPDAEVRTKVARLQPSHVLGVGFKGSRMDVDRTFMNNEIQAHTRVRVVLTFNLWDRILQRPVWRGDLQYSATPEPETVAEELFRQLETEKLL